MIAETFSCTEEKRSMRARGEELAKPMATSPLDREDREMLTPLPLSLMVAVR
jgi:hypothetical protein